MKNSFNPLVNFILLIILLELIIIILLFIDLISINDVAHNPTYPSFHLSDLNTFHYNYDYNNHNKNCIFNPFIDLFYKKGYYPSYFIKGEVRLDCPYSNLNLTDIISHRQYYILDKTYNNNDINELLSDLSEIIKEYRKDMLLIN